MNLLNIFVASLTYEFWNTVMIGFGIHLSNVTIKITKVVIFKKRLPRLFKDTPHVGI
jgi:hypothetical protein